MQCSVNVHCIAQATKELKYSLNEDGSLYIKATFLNQVWLRYNQSNPGTLVSGEPSAHTFDIGLRRTRLQLYGQLTDHVFFYTQFGQNNFNYLAQTAGNRKIQAFFHDALGEYKVWKANNALKLGAGLTITNGLSRFSQPSIGTIMTMDVPVFAQATVDQTDEFSRKLSVYARGQVGKLDYRVAVTDPFPVTTNGQPLPALNRNATFAQRGHEKQYQGLFLYIFFDQENHTTPYMTGTYLGKKRVLNLEAGFITQRKATWRKETLQPDTTYEDMKLWSVAVFYDAPLNTAKGTAISAYTSFFHYDYGKSYLRYNGIMNPANGLVSGAIPGSQGNAFPMFGTGNIIYSQLGYLLPENLLGSTKAAFMPYASWMHADYGALQSSMDVIDIGMNWLMNAHATKLTIDYQLRPVFTSNNGLLTRSGHKGQLVLQYQIYF